MVKPTALVQIPFWGLLESNPCRGEKAVGEMEEGRREDGAEGERETPREGT